MANFVLKTHERLVGVQITLDGEDFRKLIRGQTLKMQIVHQKEVLTLELNMSDIGFAIMKNHIEEAEHESQARTSGDSTLPGRG